MTIYTVCRIIDGMKETLYNSSQVAERTNRTTRTIQALAKNRGIGQKIGRDWLFTEEDVAQIEGIDYRGGKLPRNGQTREYRVPLEKAKKKGPPKKQPLVDSPAVSS
jgi:hypothetical protein